MNLKKKLSSSVRPALYSMLVKTGKLAENMRLEAYLVGGPVRDVLLGAANLDMDITVEGDGIAFAEKLASRFGGGACYP